MNKKSLRIAVIIIVVLACTAGLLLFREQLRSMRLNAQAYRLIAKGEYEKARDIFRQLEDEKMIQSCEELITHRRYLDAKTLLDSGDYEAAKDMLLTVRGHLDADELIRKCDFLRGCALEDEGDLFGALEQFKSLENYPEASERLSQVSSALYLRGVEMLKGCSFSDAYATFSALGDYLDSANLASRCSARIAMESDGSRAISDEENIYSVFPGGKLYIADTGYVYIPDNYSAETEFLIFFPGGRDIEEARDYIYSCIESCKDTVILFLYRNGLYDMDAKAKAALATLQKAADECGITLKAPLLCGTSMGAYPAMRAAVYYYVNHSLTVPKVLCFDAGVDWEESDLTLSEADCHTLSETGTELWLLEQQGVGMDRAGIRLMVLSGCDVTVIACKNGEHNAILNDALSSGMIGFAQGKTAAPQTDNYVYIRLKPDSYYPQS